MPRRPLSQCPPRGPCGRALVALVALAATLGTAETARAADNERDAPGSRGSTAGQSRRAAPDFLFGRPRSVVGVAGGWLFASERGGIFDLTRDLLTVEDGNFDTALVRFELGRSLGPRFDLVAEFGFSGVSIASEYRDFVDGDDLPIVQTTELWQVPVGGSVRYWLVPRGREVGRFAWVPSRVAPYVGAGGGAQWYRFTQFGDFVDFVDFSIFTERLESNGWGASRHVFVGASVNVARQLFVGFEARYVWADSVLSQDFVGFDNIALSGLQATGSIEFVF